MEDEVVSHQSVISHYALHAFHRNVSDYAQSVLLSWSSLDNESNVFDSLLRC